MNQRRSLKRLSRLLVGKLGSSQYAQLEFPPVPADSASAFFNVPSRLSSFVRLVSKVRKCAMLRAPKLTMVLFCYSGRPQKPPTVGNAVCNSYEVGSHLNT
jgi:hypothetical protein